jgi:hypothetical protein
MHCFCEAVAHSLRILELMNNPRWTGIAESPDAERQYGIFPRRACEQGVRYASTSSRFFREGLATKAGGAAVAGSGVAEWHNSACGKSVTAAFRS